MELWELMARVRCGSMNSPKPSAMTACSNCGEANRFVSTDWSAPDSTLAR
jgi:hypothetical protein